MSEYWSMTVKELKSKLRERTMIVSGKKHELIGRIMRYDIEHSNITVIRDKKYTPTKEDKKYGVVSNLPWEYQEKVCASFGRSLFYTKVNSNHSHDMSLQEITEEVKKDLLSTMVYIPEIWDETAVYTGYTPTHFKNDYFDWECEADEDGKVFTNILVKIVTDIWEESVKEHEKQCYLYQNPQWGYDNPYDKYKIANTLEGLVRKKREKLQKQTRLRNLLKGTFLYGCAKKNSGSILLPLIGARYAYGPVRRQIAEYVGAIDP